MKNLIKNILKKFGWKLIKIRKPPEPNPYGKLDIDVLRFMNSCKGILHLGAHRGLEAEVYNWFGKKTIWVEALPKTYELLLENLYFYKNQIAFQALLTNKDDEIINFYVSNYDAACSSIYSFTDNIKSSDIWSDRNHEMVKSVRLQSSRLDTIFSKNKINAKEYDHWILDLQGAELLALKGAEESLAYCNSIYIEVSIKKFYTDAVIWIELKNWLATKNFYPTRSPEKDEEDILFIRKN
jgi:FkbM family methyltransferase